MALASKCERAAIFWSRNSEISSNMVGRKSSVVVAEIAKSMGLLTVAIVTKPFAFEGPQRMKRAEMGLAKLSRQLGLLGDVVDEGKNVLTAPEFDVVGRRGRREALPLDVRFPFRHPDLDPRPQGLGEDIGRTRLGHEAEDMALVDCL